MPASINLTTTQKVKVTLAPTTESGNPATLDGEPQWTVESGDCTVEPEEGGLSAYILAGGSAGESIVKVAADADLGQGVRTIEDLVTVNVTSEEAAALGLTVGAPEEKTPEDLENQPHPDQTLPGDLPGGGARRGGAGGSGGKGQQPGKRR
jgi:hypothetical protein